MERLKIQAARHARRGEYGVAFADPLLHHIDAVIIMSIQTRHDLESARETERINL